MVYLNKFIDYVCVIILHAGMYNPTLINVVSTQKGKLISSDTLLIQDYMYAHPPNTHHTVRALQNYTQSAKYCHR